MSFFASFFLTPLELTFQTDPNEPSPSRLFLSCMSNWEEKIGQSWAERDREKGKKEVYIELGPSNFRGSLIEFRWLFHGPLGLCVLKVRLTGGGAQNAKFRMTSLGEDQPRAIVVVDGDVGTKIHQGRRKSGRFWKAEERAP